MIYCRGRSRGVGWGMKLWGCSCGDVEGMSKAVSERVGRIIFLCFI